MPENKKICPVCGQEDLVFKVRVVYLESLEKLKNWESTKTPELDRFLKESGQSEKSKAEMNKVIRDLVQQFGPPSGKPQVLKTISPDMVVVVFSALALFILYQIYFAQPEIFWYMVALFAVFLASFFIFHKSIISRFQKQKSMDTGSIEVIQKAIGKWMKVSYCLRDNLIFEPGKAETAPLNELTRFLIKASLPE